MSARNSILMREAYDALSGKWGLAIGTFLLYCLITGSMGAIPPPGTVVSLLIAGPLALGASVFSLAIARNEAARLEQIFEGFNRFTAALGAYLLMVLYVLLWSLLLVVPGIIAALSYSMTFYIMADERLLTVSEALEKSKQMMQGNKARLFGLCLRFFLLALLCVLTLGIGFLWLIPFANVAMARFYEDVRSQRN